MLYKLYRNKTFLFTFVLSLLLLFSINVNVTNAQNVGNGASISVAPVQAIPGALVTIQVNLVPPLTTGLLTGSNEVEVVYFPPGNTPPPTISSVDLSSKSTPSWFLTSCPNTGIANEPGGTTIVNSPILTIGGGYPPSDYLNTNCVLAAVTSINPTHGSIGVPNAFDSNTFVCSGNPFGNMYDGQCYDLSTNTIYINTRYIPPNPPGKPYTIAVYAIDNSEGTASEVVSTNLWENESYTPAYTDCNGGSCSCLLYTSPSPRD